MTVPSANRMVIIRRYREGINGEIGMPVTKVDGSLNSHKVFLYTLSTCGWCKLTKQLLKDKSVAYEYLDVDVLKAEDRKAAIEDLQKRKAPLGFPIIIIDDTQLISGYQPEKILGALGL